VDQDQSEAEKKRDEAAQHPRSEVERIILRRIEADQIESDCDGQAERSDDDAPAQHPLIGFRFGLGQTFFRKRQGFSVTHVAQKGEKSKDNEKNAYNTDARDEVGEHGSSSKR